MIFVLQNFSNAGGKEQDYLEFCLTLATELVGTCKSLCGQPCSMEHAQCLGLKITARMCSIQKIALKRRHLRDTSNGYVMNNNRLLKKRREVIYRFE